MTAYFLHHARRRAALVAVPLLILAGCGLDEVDIPPVVGPAELGISVDMKANPDIIPANGVSTSVVTMVVRDPNGAPLGGVTLYVNLLCPGDGGPCADGFLTPAQGFAGDLTQGFALVSDANGNAAAVYTAGTAPNTTAAVAVRPYSFDAGQFFYRWVYITQR